jgi:AcrR family transcriptional regulator
VADGATQSTDATDPHIRALNGARSAFASFGIQKTTMRDIASAAGMSRSGLYNLGVSKTDLADAAIVTRLGELGEVSRLTAERDLPFADSLLATTLQITEGARRDAALTRMLETTEAMHLHRLLTGPHPRVHDYTLRVFEPVFRRARARQEMRADVSDDQAADWLRFVLASLILHRGLDQAGEQDLVMTFLVPSLAEPNRVSSPAAPVPASGDLRR